MRGRGENSKPYLSISIPFHLICSEDAFRWSEAGGVLAVLLCGSGRRVQDPGRGSLDA